MDMNAKISDLKINKKILTIKHFKIINWATKLLIVCFHIMKGYVIMLLIMVRYSIISYETCPSKMLVSMVISVIVITHNDDYSHSKSSDSFYCPFYYHPNTSIHFFISAFSHCVHPFFLKPKSVPLFYQYIKYLKIMIAFVSGGRVLKKLHFNQ